MENNPQTKSKKIQNYQLGDSESMMHLALDLAKFIKENKLYQNIQGKEFVNVEGWQYAGARLGLVPIVEGVVNHSTESEIKYQAAVYLVDLNRNREQVGSGFAVCSNKEQGKKFYQEFAIESMAQTRAIGKAYRNLLAWIIRAAGYEPTPAEEMDYNGSVPEPSQNKPVEAAKTTELPVTPNPAQKPTSPATDKQKDLIKKLIKSSVFTTEEREKVESEVDNYTFTKASKSIEYLNAELRTRKQNGQQQ